MDGFEKLTKLYNMTSNVFLNEEDFLAYRPGGFHPVTLGDTLKDGRYKIYHKLGYGGFSTVWVAKDRRHQQWVSIKIAKADGLHQSRELQNSQSLMKTSKSSLGSEHIVQLRDNFVHKGPNGSHQCLVFELLGPTVDIEVASAHSFNERIDTDTIIRTSTQILKALTFMHKAGYAHGDLSARNVAFWSPHLSRLSKEKLLEALGPPDPKKVTRLDGNPPQQGIPTEVVQSARWPGWPLDEDDDEDDEEDENIRLIDLGEAFQSGTIPKKLAQPPDMQAPEQIFIDKFDYRQDLWRAGLMIYYLIFGALPCAGFGSNQGLVSMMIMVFEDLPPQWERKWKQLVDEAKANKAAGFEDETWLTNLDHRLEKQFDKEVLELKLKRLLPVIHGLTRLLPANRITASEALAMIQNEKSREKSRAKNREEERL